MSRRIDIELTSALGDGTWTWRAAGAKQPKGVLDGSVLPAGAKVGDELKVEVEQDIDGVNVLSVVHGRQKADRDDLLEMLPSETEFQPVVETRAKRGKGERRDRGDRGDRGERRGRRDRGGGGKDGDRRGRGDRDRDGGGDRRQRRDRSRRGPSFTPPPEVPQRPKPKRLRPGKAHRNDVLNALPEAQRPVAELALQGMQAVRQRLREENEKAVAEGRATMPEASVLKLAEELLPRLRVAEWRDRAEAAQRQMEHLDLRDLRSVVAAATDPAVTRDETTRPLVEELQAALVTKQEQELQLWFGDVDAALAVGRVVRALRLSSQPPKAGVPFPADIAQRLVDSANASLAPMDSPERWIAMLEAAAFSPVRSQIRPARKPDVVNDELAATVKRLAPALPQVAELFEIEVDPDAPMPKPLRQGPRTRRDGKGGPSKQRADKPSKQSARRGGGRRKGQRTDADAPAAEKPATEKTAAAASPPAPAETTDASRAAEPSQEPTPDEPAATADEPTATADEPTATADQPATTSEEPATEPTAAADEPTATADEPTTTSDKPATEPTATADEPTAIADEPATTSDGPATEPTATADEPTASANEPTATSDKPATEPTATADEPATTSEEPATEPTATADEPTTTADDPTAADPEGTEVRPD